MLQAALSDCLFRDPLSFSQDGFVTADFYTGRGQTILLEREKRKRMTMKLRRLQHAKSAAQLNTDER